MSSPIHRTSSPSRLSHLGFRAKEALIYPVQDWRRRRIQERTQPTEIINQKEICLVGMRRSGNHAVLNWIRSQQPGDVCLLNNVAAGTNPYRYKSDNLRRYHPEHHKQAEVYRQQASGNLIKRDCLIYSYEDWSLRQIIQPRFERNRDLYVGKSGKSFELLVLRDPFNLFASRLKQNFVATKARKLPMVEMWLEHAREFVGESGYLKRNRICISYNRWFSNMDYRRSLADQLDIPFSDAGLENISAFGGGSSFDGTGDDSRLSGRASALDVTNRWRQFADDPRFQSLFASEALWHYSTQIFGELPGTDSLQSRHFI
ncbi:hypothetical protein [cf. Phormidesmis sp. LEGE 11477]|uniref:hypothetical protein n=1 Tax=cf. Phormidesmis sp. LEGE 11477 TaxID=1828680 RepID=UPI00187E4F10|nr:hypothetical protein [cf. Phormidesmis sp. LEGE 11477]MBE9064332.1 hypothetical protein [cf. Phormidesmis sp. LEGE 11477]